jgi:hypothetical protein
MSAPAISFAVIAGRPRVVVVAETPEAERVLVAVVRAHPDVVEALCVALAEAYRVGAR